MYAGGRVIPAVDTYRHQRRDFGTAAAIYDSGMKRVPLDERRRGDLVFYGPTGSSHPHGHLPWTRQGARVGAASGAPIADGDHGVPLKPRVVRPFGR